MKTLKMKLEGKLKLQATTLGIAMAALVAGFAPLQVVAQDEKKSYSEIESTQDEIEALYVEVYDIIDKYPNATYQYFYDDADVTAVVTGIPVSKDKKQLEVALIDLENLKKEIFNMSSRTGIYYVTETEPEPEMGYKDFYASLRDNLTYPEEAKANSVEGLVYVKFIVDSKGNIDQVYASERIDTSIQSVRKDMKMAAKAAVKATSGQWKPAEIGGIPVPHWVVLPVQFKLESPFFIPLY